jgi:VIT1/CCC1 family predicted Fe2+/Mn2+ transporter
MTRPIERHRGGHTGWLRAAVLGANDGILSTSSLVLGVAAAHGSRSSVLMAGIAGLVSGAMSMAAGEYISVHSQADTERADLNLERGELKADDKGEHAELAAIYVERGLDSALATQVANQLMAHDALGAHARDELGISEPMAPRPIQAAFASAFSFSVGAALPLLVAIMTPQLQGVLAGVGRFAAAEGIAPFLTLEGSFLIAVSGASLLFLALLGALAARAGGAPMGPGALRVTFWGALAMGVTAGVGALFGTIV